ncbi:MAG: DsrE family protein [Parabacteroides sp.]
MNDKLNILWTTDNKDTIFNMLAMYTLNSKKRGWWQEVNVILWGASSKVSRRGPHEVQAEILEMLQTGVTIKGFCQTPLRKVRVKPVVEKLGRSYRQDVWELR